MRRDDETLGLGTQCIHAGQEPDPTTGSVNVPIYQTSTYKYVELGEHTGYEYARVQNPTRRALELNLAALERGVDGHAFASGMAAITTLMTLVRADEHVVASDNVYGGTYRLFEQVLDRYRLRVTWVDSSDLGAVEAAMEESTRLIFIESPTNPLMDVTDIRGVCELAHRHDALVAVDNTFLSPYLQRPLELGADIVVHSTTKFLNGHSDSIGGALIPARQEHADWFAFMQKSAGAILSPFDSFLTLRGIKTLAVRMDRHERNAGALARHLESAGVGRVLYPGLESHPGRDVHAGQADGFGAMIAMDLETYDRAKRFLDSLEVMTLAESLGGVESLVCHPASMTHASIPEDERQALGIGDGLVRFSVGIEDLQDLVADVDRALAAI